jgi:Tfp pilus assembly protein PilX
MNPTTQKSRRESERGVALLIALFALLLISAMAAGLIVISGTETSIDANYRTSVQGFFDARAGIEEGRGRLWTGSANSIATWVTPVGTTLLPGQVRYIINPASGETVAPNVVGNKYYDSEYAQEWGGTPITAATVTTTNSSYPAANLRGPLYKWVRITAATELSTNTDVNNDGVKDPADPLFYDGKQQLLSTASQLNCPPLGVITNSACQAWQVYTVTALAVTPSGSQRLLQYEVAPTYLNLNFPSALTLDGPGAVYNPASSFPFVMDGYDRSSTQVSSCPISAQPPKPAIGATSNSNVNSIASAITATGRQDNYVGYTCPSPSGCSSIPSVANISSQLDPSQQTPATLDALVQTLTDNATYVVSGPATGLPSYGTAANPVIAVVTGANNGAGGTGDLTLSGGVTGYGILVVTGNFNFSGNTGWNGVVLVIGQGYALENGGGSNEFDGAFFIAKTRDSSGNELSSLGTPTLNWNGGGNNGIWYDSCWINNAGQTALYKVLSFREIPQ